MATKRKAVKKKAVKKNVAKRKAVTKAIRSKPVEILIGKNGEVPETTHVSIAKNGGAYWKSADKKAQWEIYFLSDPFDASIVTATTSGKTKTLSLHDRTTAGDQFTYHFTGPRQLRKGQTKVSSTGGIVIDA